VITSYDHQRALDLVSEAQVLLVRQTRICFGLQNIVLQSCLLPVSEVVTIGIVSAQCESEPGQQTASYHQRYLCRHVSWSVLGLEGLRSNQIADVEASVHEGGDEGAFGVAGRVGHAGLN
jgi:hypothetical protein